ncbi:TlpA family protein disulfide reductase [Singulisphaera sp. PoT]|uniref:TlpA family protein disulfide reductase n=1 Tax=Singulisphaera sp. PoT TaxID=3411797 RepID=UPI003BF55C75
MQRLSITGLMGLILASAVGSSPARGQDAAEKLDAKSVLRPGMRAPEFRVERFLKGEPFSALKRGEVYVFDFWASGCGPCVMSMPHLSELQREYRDRHVTICGVNIWEAAKYDASTLEAASKFVEKQGDKMDFTVAYDGAAKFMDDNWMHAAERNGIPCTFVLDREGVVAWIGHPMMLDMVLEEVCQGRWDIASGPKRLKLASAAFTDAEAKYKESLAAGDAAWEAAMTQYPALGRTKTSQRLIALLQAGHFAAAHDAGERLIADSKKNKSAGTALVVLEALAAPKVLADDSARELLLKAAEAYFSLVDTKEYAPHIVLARAYFYSGRDDEARAAAAKALELAPAEVRARVEEYLKDIEGQAKQK